MEKIRIVKIDETRGWLVKIGDGLIQWVYSDERQLFLGDMADDGECYHQCR